MLRGAEERMVRAMMSVALAAGLAAACSSGGGSQPATDATAGDGVLDRGVEAAAGSGGSGASDGAVGGAPGDAAFVDARSDAAGDAQPSDTEAADAAVDVADAADGGVPSFGQVLPPLPAGDPICYASGWCWSNPTPLGGHVSVAARAADDVWVAGPHGITRRFDGRVWTTVPTPTEADLTAIWAASASDAWAVGNDVVLRWNGVRWAVIPPPAGAVFDFGGNIIHGRSASDVWVASSRLGSVWHFDGRDWTELVQFDRVKDLQVLADGTVLVQPDGSGPLGRLVPGETAFTVFARGAPGVAARGLWAFGPSDLWESTPYALAHFDGQAWRALLSVPQSGVTTFQGVAGAAPDDVWFSNLDGTMTRWHGSSFERWLTGAYSLARISARAVDDVWAGGESGSLIHFDGQGWRRLSTGVPVMSVEAMWSAGPDDVWAVGANREGAVIARYQAGVGWRDVAPVAGAYWLYDVWGSGANDIWAAGTAAAGSRLVALLIHWDGTAWAPVAGAGGAAANHLWGAGASDVWAVGAAIARWNGAQWANVTEPVAASGHAPWAGVSGTAPDDVWLACAQPNQPLALHHWNGSAWTLHALDVAIVEPSAGGVLARARNDVFAWTRSRIFHYDGQSWQMIRAAPEDGYAFDAHALAVAGGDVWLATREGVLERWDGQSWHASDRLGPVFNVVHATARDVWIADSFGGSGIMRRAR